MHEYYKRTDAKGQLVESRVHMTYRELMELIGPHIAPDGFKLESFEDEPSGVFLHFVRQDNG